ncbi:MAG: type III polyketide synthase [Fibrobacterota bacterium]
MGDKNCFIQSVAGAVPDTIMDQGLADKLMTRYYEGELRPRSMDVLHKILKHPSIKQRHISVDSHQDLSLIRNEDPDVRIERFNRWAVELSSQATDKALQKAGKGREDIGALIVNTCTGYVCPGIATYLIEKMGLSRSTPVYDLVGSGCGGAIPNIQLGQSLQVDDGKVVVCVSVEICSATFQMSDDISLVLSNALFGDGAAAAVLGSASGELKLIDSAGHFLPQFREDVRYVYRNGALHNKLSPQLPKVIREVIPPLVEELLRRNDLSVRDIGHWAIHPGGDKMVSAIQQELQITDSQMESTRTILRDYGNMSSPSVLFILERELTKGIEEGQWCVMIGYGAGLSAFAYLTRKVSS